MLNDQASRRIGAQKVPPALGTLARPRAVNRAKDTPQDDERPAPRAMTQEVER